MNRIFRKKNMRWIAVLLSVAVLSGSMDVNMLHVQAAQEQSAYAEDEEGIMHDDADQVDLSDDAGQQNDTEKDKDAGQQDDNAGADDDQPADADNNDDEGKKDDAGSDDDSDSKNDDAESEDNVGSQDGEKPGDDADREDGENQQEEEPVEDADMNEDDTVDDESNPVSSSKVTPLADGDPDPAPSGPVKIGVSVSGIAIADKIYDGKPSTCTGTVVLKAKTGEGGAEEDVVGATVSYSISGETFDGVAYNKTPTSINTEMPKDAGTYTLKVSVSGSNDQYIYEGSLECPFTISQRQVIIAAEDKQIKITQTTAPKYTYRISGLVLDDKLTKEPEFSCEKGEESFGIPGQYSITVFGADAGSNYSIIYQAGTLTILDKELATISGFSIADKVYDGKPIECTEPTVSGGGQSITDYEYSIYGVTESGEEYRRPETGEGSTAAGIKADMPTDAGKYKVKIKVPSDNTSYKGNWQYDFEITRKKVTITARNVTISKGERLPKFEYDAVGFVEGEKNPFENDSSTGDSSADDNGNPREPRLTCSAKDTDTPGQYAIVPSGAFAGANYTIEYQPGILTILDEESVSLTGIEINGGRNSKIYDGDPIELKLTPQVQKKDGTIIPESELEFKYSISGTLADEDGTAYSSIGDMTDPANRPKDAGQYILEVRVFQVTKSAEGDSSTGDDTTGNTTGDGSDTSGSSTRSVSREEIFRQEYSFTITPRVVSVTVKDIEITAGDPMPAPAEDEAWYEVGGLGFIDGDDFEKLPEFVCDLEDTETSGIYPITAANADAGFNYTIAYVPGKLTITEREVVKTRELVRIVAPNPVLNIQNGTPLDAIELPATVYIKTKEIAEQDGSSTAAVSEERTQQVEVEWIRRPAEGTSYSSGTKTAQRFILHGTAVLPADVDAGAVSTTVAIEVSVREEITSREQVKNPTASVPSGTAVRRGTKITLSCETEGAEIYYTLDDKNPPTKEKGLLYTWPIEVSKYTVIWARAYKDGCPESEIVKFSYFINNSIVGPGEDDDSDEPQVPPEDIPSDGRIPSGLWVTENAESAYLYTGKAIKPVVRVYDYKTLLVEKKDYTISYKNNVNAADKNDPLKPPTITITGKGNYSGKLIKKFTITPKDIGDPDVSVDDITLAYNAKKPKAQKPTPTVMWKNKKLTNKKDYTYVVPDEGYTNVGTCTITVTGCGNYTGKKEFEFTITDGILVSSLTVSKIPDQVYTGEEIKPKPEVRYKGEKLSLKQNYELAWENNKEVGTGTVIIKGVKDGRYVGTKKVTFKITAAASLSKAKVELETGSKTYTGQEIKVEASSVMLKVGNEMRSLVKGEDYEVSYQNNVKAGKATVIFTGKNAYDGKIKKTFTITPLNIESKEVTVTLGASYPYAKGGAKPEPKVTYNKKALTLGKDYTLSYKQNDAAGNIATVTVKGKGNFGGSTIRTFTVTPQDIKNVTVNAADKFYRNKKNIYKTTVRLIDSTGKPLSAGSDYDKEIKYTYADDVKDADNKILWAKGTEVNQEDIIPAGTKIQVEVNAKGNNYTGSVTGTYRIAAANISKAKVTIPSQSYTGKEIKPDSQIDVRVDGVKLTLDKDYEIVGYSNNVKKGTGKVVIHGLGNYGGTKTVSFKIVSKALGD